jgi:RND family efflux transporter MFP subunit
MMRKKVLIGITILCAALLTGGCSGNERGSKSMEQLYSENGVPVRVAAVSAGRMSREFTYHAVLTGIRESNASSMVSDRVEKIFYSVGDRVEKDAVVLSFPTDNPSAQYFQAKVNVEHARTTLERMENLYASGGISLQDLDGVRTQAKVAEANWDAVRRSVEVKAPIGGILSSLDVRESDNVESGDVLFTITQTEILKAKLWVTENAAVELSSSARVVARWEDCELLGRVVQVDRSINSEMQAFGVVVELDNEEAGVMSGVNAEIILYIESGEETIVIERKNLMKEGGKYFVFTAEDSIAVKKPVAIGRLTGSEVEIIGGLFPGELLVTEGQLLLDDSKKIRIVRN